MITPLLYATWLLCGLGAVVFASTARRGWLSLAQIAAAFFLSVWLPRDPGSIGLLTAVAAVALIVRPHWDWIAPLSAGLLIGVLDYSVWYVVIAVAAVLAAYAVPSPLRIIREEALVGVAIFGLVVAVAPSVAAGWQSALALNVVDKTNTALAVPNWVLLLVAGSVLIGGLYQGIYKRR